ncbi:MAG: DUF465 domain-containing protein [Verrucomicrobia bacterium]|nr:DUF465 domain-containing protein [Verrucomicrobiota bacterium]MDA1066614.1 DUF465 domain-containing protein [Verrucomicrobiota bacterium]
MLGEHHDIDREFPEYHAQLEALSTKDERFKELVEQHDSLDNRIRRLEEKQLPISDIEIEKMKFERTALKDRIYQALRLAK